MSKRKKRNIYPIIIFIATLFMGIGYASVNSVLLGVGGTVQANLQDGIYITDVSYDSSVTADYENSEIIYAYQTMLNSNIILSESDSNSSITYEITIYNSSADDYVFVGEEHMESEDTYSNEDITFKLNGLTPGDILDGKESITFTITFYYKDNILSENNSLNSFLNFNFEKCYSVTYENVSGTHVNYALAGKTFKVTFSSTDPLEIKMGGNILSTSKYTFSNKVLTIPNVTGTLHIRKKILYTIKNKVTNGSFENGLTGWNQVGGSSYLTWHETTIVKFGSKAYYRMPSKQSDNYLRQSQSFVKNHKYYFFAFAISTTTQPFYADIVNTSSNLTFNAVPQGWKRGALIYTSAATENRNIHINFGPITDNVIVDGIGMIDLTAAFGSGNEPSLEWCNTNINYFDGSMTVYK